MTTQTGNVWNAAVAGEIRAEMARQQLSGRELARRVSKPETTVARYVRGATAMSVDDIEVFARALGVTTVDLIARAYREAPPTPPATPRANNSNLSRLITRAPRATVSILNRAAA